jgi:hypothetical protein
LKIVFVTKINLANPNPKPNSTTKTQPNPNPYTNNKPQPNPNPNFTTWEVAKVVHVLLNAKTLFFGTLKNYLYPGTLLDLFL